MCVHDVLRDTINFAASHSRGFCDMCYFGNGIFYEVGKSDYADSRKGGRKQAIAE